MINWFTKFLFYLLFCLTTTLFPQNDQIINNSYFYPNENGDRKIFHTIGLSTAEAPEDLIETAEVLRAPLFFYRIKYKLPANLLLEGAAESNIITYHVSLGPGWSYNFDKFGVSAGTDLSWWYGRLKREGFNSEITGWNLFPHFSAGYCFPYFTITLKTDFFLILDQVSKLETITEDVQYDTFSGFSLALYLEQPLWRDHYIVLGIKSNFTKFYAPLWVAFNTFDRYLYISEIILGYNF